MNKLSLFVTVAIVIFLIFTVSCVSKEVPVTETYYETEYKTEYKMETYTGIEDVVVHTSEGQTHLTPVSTWQTGLYFKVEGSGTGMTYYYGYEIDTSKHTRNQVKILVSSMAEGYIGVCNLIDVGQIPPKPGVVGVSIRKASGELSLLPQEQAWFDKLNAILTNPERVLVFQPMIVGTGDEISFDTKGVKEFAILANTWNVHAITSVKLVWSDDIFERRTVTKERRVPYQVPVQVEKQRTVTVIKKVPIWEAMLTEETPSTTPAAPLTSPEPPVSPATTPEAEPPVPSSSLLYEDDFSNPNRGFLGEITATHEIYNKDSQYHILVKEWDWTAWDFNYMKGLFTDFTLEIDATLVAGSNQSAYGLIFRVPITYDVPIIYDFYRFLVNGNGYYLIGTRTNGQWTVLRDWTRSEFIEEGYSTNHLKIICKGSQIEAYVNGHYLTTVTDESFVNGRVGVIVDTPEPNTHVTFDNLKVYIPD